MCAAKLSNRHWLKTKHSQVSVARELLAAGADFSVKDANGKTAFDLAIKEEGWAALNLSTNVVDVLRQAMGLPSRMFLLCAWAILSSTLFVVGEILSFDMKFALCVGIGVVCFLSKDMALLSWTSNKTTAGPKRPPEDPKSHSHTH
jgi:hypothetical protein